MILVCLAHFNDVYLGGLPSHELQFTVLQRIAMLASPTFVMISGVLLGFLYRSRPEGMPALKAKLVDRGLFLLTVGHLLIVGAHIPVAGGLGAALTWGFITDVIGLGLLIGPMLVERVGPATRLALAAAAYIVSWIAVAGWRPDSPGLEGAKEYLFGPAHFLNLGPRVVFECFPLLPWLAVYVAATVLGERLGALSAARRGEDVKITVTRAAVTCLLIGLIVKGLPFALRAVGLWPSSELAWTLGWPFQKQPPSPAYLALFVGLGLLMLRGVLAIDARPELRRWLTLPAALGRASLAAFIVQYYVYFTLVAWWRPPFSPFWPLLFVASACVVLTAGLLWERHANNDVFGVGYRQFTAALPRLRKVHRATSRLTL